MTNYHSACWLRRMWWEMFVMFSFHLSDCLVFRKQTNKQTASVDNQAVLCLWIVGDKPSRNEMAWNNSLFFSPSSLVFSRGRAQSSCSCALAGVARAVSRLAETLGWLGLSLQVLWPLLHVAAPSGLASRVAGPLMWQLRAPQAIRQ